MALSKEDIVNQIRAAFLGVQRPPDEKLLHFPNTGDNLWVDSFLGNTETDWIDINPQKIEYECSALTAFSPSAFGLLLTGLYDLDIKPIREILIQYCRSHTLRSGSHKS